MMQQAVNDTFQNKYRTKSHRMVGWDYSNAGCYFITVVTQNRKCLLGEIINGVMVLSDFGKIVQQQWNKSFEIRDELLLDEHIIMPNHIHAIVILNKPEKNNGDGNTTVETHGRASLPPPPPPPGPPPRPQFRPQLQRPKKSISSFLGGFKSAVNSKIDDFIDEHNLDIPKYNRNNHFFQPNYYDHIIRNNKSYQRISEYIINNPLKWNEDKLNADDNKNRL